MKRIFTLAAGAALAFALGCGGNSASPTAPGQPGPSESTGINAIVSIRIEAPDTLTVGDTAQLKVMATLAGGTLLDVTAKALFSVSDSAKATVSASGELKALAPGDCGLTALVGSISANFRTHIRARVGGIVRLEIRGKLDLDLGEKTQLKAIAILDTGSELDVTAKAVFTSSNDAILKVSASGLLEALGEGTCDLLSIVDDVRATVKISVRGKSGGEDGNRVVRIVIRGKVSLNIGEKTQLRAIAVLYSGAESDVTERATFSSSNESVLRVYTGGQAEAMGEGSSDVHGTVDGVRGSENVRVSRTGGDDGNGSGDPKITKIEIRGNGNLDLGEKSDVKVVGVKSDGSETDMTSKATYSCDNDSILRVVAAGRVEAVGIGTALLKVSVDGLTASLHARVQLGAIVKLEIEGPADLVVGEKLKVRIFGTNHHGIRLDLTSQTELTTSNHSILKVNVGAIVEALGPGSCDLIAIHGNVRAFLRLSVKAKAAVIVRLRLDGAAILHVGQTVLLKVIATLSDGTEHDVTDKVKWEKNNDSCGLSLGIVTGLVPGDCLITALLDGISAKLLVNVRATVLTIVKLRIEGLTVLKLGQSAQLKAIATMSDGSEQDVTSRVAWTSNNLLCLLVNVSGLLNALLPGDCLITGIVDGVKATLAVKVTL
jgi:hypothetical protein